MPVIPVSADNGDYATLPWIPCRICAHCEPLARLCVHPSAGGNTPFIVARGDSQLCGIVGRWMTSAMATAA
jgi:hypothetical protein